MSAKRRVSTTHSTIRILVLGDLSLDTLIVPLPPKKQASKAKRMAWENEGKWWRHERPGGAWLLQEIINAAMNCQSFANSFEPRTVETDGVKTNKITDKSDKSSPAPHFLTSAAILGVFPRTTTGNPRDKRQTYRVEKILGWIHDERDDTKSPGDGDRYAKRLEQCLKPYARANKPDCDILVFHDNANYFRRLPLEFLKEVVRRNFTKGRTWIVWNMYSPLAEGNLWNVIRDQKQWLDRTIAVVKMECLRQAGMHLPQATSLEQESRLFVKGMKRVAPLKELTKVRHLVVHQHREGVLHYDRVKGLQTTCYYCPYIREDTSTRDCGIMVGYTSILVAAIVRGLAWSLNDASQGIIAGIKQGAVLDHLHYLSGFGDESLLTEPAAPTPYKPLFDTLSGVLAGKDEAEKRRYFVTALPLRNSDLSRWNRIDGFIKQKFDAKEDGCTTVDEQAEKIAFSIVRRGLQAVVEVDAKPNMLAAAETEVLPDTPPEAVRCPYEEHGKIKTAYDKDIDSFASIKRIMEKYLNDARWTTPLSIAVFGPPGSGKSFTIRQILESINPDLAKRPLEYNLAQFGPYKELEVAFHRVQDEALAGGVPLVFFDEFDTGRLDWLKHFLAPMQDGKFKAGESTYRIGRAIFVFAGGVYKEWSEFYKNSKAKQFKDTKATDFVSRLRGHLDIQTINCPKVRRRPPGREDNVTGVLMFRRAVLLRSLLEQHFPVIVDKTSNEAAVDTSVLRAFLRILRYEHEVRSMEAIIQMSRLSPRGDFQRSSLPAYAQLNMHVDADEFCHLMEDRQH